MTEIKRLISCFISLIYLIGLSQTGSEKVSVHCSLIVYHVHQIERRGGAVQGPCFQAAGVRAGDGTGEGTGEGG